MEGKARVLWLTGLSGAGKSTLADALLARLRSQGGSVVRLDGDDLRTGLNSDLGFSADDRKENLRRAAHVSRLFVKLGHSVVCSFITPLNSDRAIVREILGPRYVEVYVKASLEECERRDPKGLYVRARSGDIANFTGITAPFEEPDNSDFVLNTECLSIDEAVEQLAAILKG